MIPAVHAGRRRLRLEVLGAVQGVGFRPHVHRLAMDGQLAGWVRNTSSGVEIEVEGERSRLEAFLHELEDQAPPLASIRECRPSWHVPLGHETFRLLNSESGQAKTAVVLPDAATCDDCLADVLDAANRRHRYPFTNCTNCGPRFSIIEALPYDRERTTMKHFTMCAACRAEYEDPANRRFHAQPNACPECGPQLSLWGPHGEVLAEGDDALVQTGRALVRGAIVAVKGLGGFHLFADASNADVQGRLRVGKRRSEKPFAVMVPSIEYARKLARIDRQETRLLRSTAAPIVLLERTAASYAEVCEEVAPGNPTVGLMLPSNPLHSLLMRECGRPLVATSGNLSDEPLATDEHEALRRLSGIADLFLVHDRPLARPVDDSVIRVVAGQPLILRRARGYAPFALAHAPLARPCLAVGAHQKNTVALAAGDQVVLSQHLGDLDTPAADANFRHAIESLSTLYERRAETVVSDLHPDYRSTRYAEGSGLPCHRVQHHIAHVFSCIAERRAELPLLGVSWDGTGLGTDGHVWGGEFFTVRPEGTRRYAHLREFPLPGGDCVAREPRRSALGLLWAHRGASVFDGTAPPVRAFDTRERTLLRFVLERGINAPPTSSIGRLFDAVAALIGLRQQSSFEGQAAMELEFAACKAAGDEAYPFDLILPTEQHTSVLLDWGPAIEAIVDDLALGHARESIAAKFHNMLVEAVVAIARRAGLNRVLLTGGCFQNGYLLERSLRRLREEGFEPLRHLRLPPNDGGLAVGQLAALASPAADPFVLRANDGGD